MSNNIFHAENPFTRLLYKTGSLILINLLFIVTSLPVITIGASLTALNTTCYKLKRETDVKIFPEYFKAFGKNFGQSTFIWIVSATVLCAFVYLGYICLKYGGTFQVAGCAISAIGIIMCMLFLAFVFFIVSRYNNTIMGHMRNSLKIGVANFLWGIIIWIIWGGCFVLFASFVDLIFYFGWFWILIGLALLGYITAAIYIKVFKQYEKEESGDEDGID